MTNTSIQVAAKVRAFKDYALKNGAKAGEIAVALKSDEQTVRNVSDLKATPEEVAEIAAGLERVAALARQQIEEDKVKSDDETTATKASFGDEQWHREHAELGRDVFGRAKTKVHGSSPADIRAREEGRVSPLDEGDGRDAQGRQLKKVYG